MLAVDFLFLAKLGCVVLFAAAVIHALTRAFAWWLDRVPTLEEPDRDTDPDVEEKTLVSAVPTPVAEDDVEFDSCRACHSMGALDEAGYCWVCGAKNRGAA